MKMAGVSKGMAENALNASNFGKTLDTVNEGMETFNNFSLKGGKGLKEMGKNLLSMGKGLLKTIFTPKNLVKGGVIGVLAGGAALFIKKRYRINPSTFPFYKNKTLSCIISTLYFFSLLNSSAVTFL